ncbi:TfoX/Sxy family protein [Paracoccaceae bacterium GXU_MW_L88]
MAVTEEDIAFIRDLFGPLGITTRKMFGGLGIYSGGQIFAVLDSTGILYIKARDALAEDLAAEGASQFTPSMTDKSGKTRSGAMPYWSLPEAALDDPEEAVHWARRSLEEN